MGSLLRRFILKKVIAVLAILAMAVVPVALAGSASASSPICTTLSTNAPTIGSSVELHQSGSDHCTAPYSVYVRPEYKNSAGNWVPVFYKLAGSVEEADNFMPSASCGGGTKYMAADVTITSQLNTGACQSGDGNGQNRVPHSVDNWTNSVGTPLGGLCSVGLRFHFQAYSGSIPDNSTFATWNTNVRTATC